MKYVLAIDQSTSATKAILFNFQGHPVNRSSVEHQQYSPQPGWVEHDADEIYTGAPRNMGPGTLEAIAYQVRDVLDQMVADAGIRRREIRADGGMSGAIPSGLEDGGELVARRTDGVNESMGQRG